MAGKQKKSRQKKETKKREERRKEAHKKREKTEEKEAGKGKKTEKEKEKEGKSKPKKAKLRKPSPKKKAQGIHVKSKKKMASARAVIKTGAGRIKINKRNLMVFTPKYVKMLIEEPLKIAGGLSSEVDINVNAKGSGFMSQAVASRSAIAKALVGYSGDESLRDRLLAYDRLLLVDDSRRKESKKQLGKGARGKKQSSKR